MSFSKSWNCTRRSGSCNLSFLKNSLVQINSKLTELETVWLPILIPTFEAFIWVISWYYWFPDILIKWKTLVSVTGIKAIYICIWINTDFRGIYLSYFMILLILPRYHAKEIPWDSLRMRMISASYASIGGRRTCFWGAKQTVFCLQFIILQPLTKQNPRRVVV